MKASKESQTAILNANAKELSERIFNLESNREVSEKVGEKDIVAQIDAQLPILKRKMEIFEEMAKLLEKKSGAK